MPPKQANRLFLHPGPIIEDYPFICKYLEMNKDQNNDIFYRDGVTARKEMIA